MADEDQVLEQDPQEPEAAEDAGAEGEELSEEEQLMARLKEAVEVSREELSPLHVKLDVTVPRDFIEGRMSEEFAELRREAVIPGFRKGRAPLRLVEKRFTSEVGDQLKVQLISAGYQAAVEKEELDVVGEPLFWATVPEEREKEDLVTETVNVQKLVALDRAVELMDWPKEGSLKFACEVELRPKFELPELEGIALEKPVIRIADEDVNSRIDRYRGLYASFQPVEDGGAERDDLLYVDVRMNVDGQDVTSEDNLDLPVRDTLWKNLHLTGFADAMTGRKPGETATLEVQVPDHFENVEIRGKKARLDFKVNEIKRRVLPELDQAFVEQLGYETVQEMRDTVRESLEAQSEAETTRSLRDQVGRYLVENTAFDLPPGVSARQTERALGRRMLEMMQYGVPEAEIRKNIDEMRSAARDQVMRDLKLYFILEKIADEREVEVTEERLNAAIGEIARQSGKRFDRVRDELIKSERLTGLYLQLRDEQVLDDLIAKATVTEKAPATEEEPKGKKEKQ